MANNKFEARIGANTDDFKKGLKDAEKQVSSFGGTLKKLAAGFAAVFSVAAIINFGKEIIALANKAEGVVSAFQRLDNPLLLNELRKATRNTVSDVELMTKAIQAKNFKIALSDLPTYFEFATKRAIQTGESVDYLVNSIITGIGRKSVLVMDNLGISAVELQKEVERVGDFGTAAGVIIRRELTSMGDVADTTAIKIASIGTALTNIKTGLGQKITASPFFQGIVNWVDDFGKVLQSPGMSFKTGLMGMIFKRKELTDNIKDVENIITDEYQKQQKILEKNQALAASIASMKEGKGHGIFNASTGQLSAGQLGPTIGEGLAGLQGAPSMPGQMIKEFSDMQIAVMDLSDTFAGFFSDVNLGFQGMIDGVITGLKRLVMELIAKAAFLALLSVITGVPLSGAMFQNILGPGIGSLIKGGALGTGAAKSNIPVGGVMQDQLVASLNGKQIDIIMKRYNG